MTEKVKKRNPDVAALLSLVFMGLGQLYIGQFRRAVVFLTLDILSYVAAATISPFLLSFPGVIAIYFAALILVGIRIFAVIDAFIGARQVDMVKLQRYGRWYVYVSVILVALTILIVFEIPVVARAIPSGPMMPTVLAGDYLYAIKYDRLDQSPERGDVAVFYKPPENEIEYISRIVGLPGDRIQVQNGILHINGEAVERQRIKDFVVGAYGSEVIQYIEKLPNGRTHRIVEMEGDDGRLDNTREFIVPEGHYFAISDNRDYSADSRMIGFIPAENMVGRAEILFFSTDGRARLWEVWEWPFAIRYERIGSRIN